VPQWPTGPANALACTSSRLAQRLHRSFNSRIRDECLNINAFWSLAQARVVISAWKHEYNHHRHTGIGLHTPADVHFGLAAGKAADRRAVLAAARAQHPHRFATTTAPKILDLHDTVWINRPAENSDTTEETQTTAA
jgi:putative transposase